MEVGQKFECLWDEDFSKGLPGCGSYEVCTPNTVCYVTHVVAVYKISVVSAHIETHPLSNGNTE